MQMNLYVDSGSKYFTLVLMIFVASVKCPKHDIDRLREWEVGCFNCVVHWLFHLRKGVAV